jgi:hypothetical protein
MTRPAYHPLSREKIDLLMRSENAEMERVWSRLRGALHSTIGMLSITYPRPLYWDPEYDDQRMEQEPGKLIGTPFYEHAVRNVQAAREIERMFREQGHTPELHELVDAYLDALLDEFDETRLYPEIPPSRHADDGDGIAASRAVAGR